MADLRDGFREIVDGWMLITGTADLDERLELVAKWLEINGPLLPDEEATVRYMIECQIARHMFPEGSFYDGDVE